MPQQNEIELILTAKANEAIESIQKVRKNVDDLTGTVGKSNKTLEEQTNILKKTSDATNKLTKHVSALIAAYASYEGASQFIEFMAKVEDGFIDIAKTTGATRAEMKKFSDGLYEMTKTLHGISLTELQQIAAGAGQLGVAKKDILDFTRSIAKISVALNVSAEEASTDMAVIANVFHEPVKNIDKLGSAINELSANTAADVASIIDSTKRMAGVGAQFGLTASEVMALGATMKEVGIQTEVGATALSQIMMRMQTDTEKFAKVAGVSFTEFSKLIRDKPIEALKLFFEQIGKAPNQAALLKKLGLNGAELARVTLGIANNTNKLAHALEVANKAYKEGTSIDEEFAKASDTIHAKQKDLRNAFVRLAKEITVTLTPAIKDAIDAVVEWIDSFDPETIGEFAQNIVDAGRDIGEFVSQNKAMIKTAFEMVIAFKAASKAADLFAIALGKQDFVSLAKAIGIFSGGIKSLPRLFALVSSAAASVIEKLVAMRAAALAFASSPVGLAVLGITAALTAGVYAYNKYTEAEEEHNRAVKKTQGAIKMATESFKEYGKALDQSGKLVIKSKKQQEHLLKSLKKSLAAIQQQKQHLKSLGSDEYKTELKAIEIEERSLKEAIQKVIDVKDDDIKKNKEAVESSKKYADSVTLMSDSHRDAINKIISDNQKRYSNEINVLNQLILKERQYENAVIEAQNRIAQTRLKYHNQRVSIEESYQERLKNFMQRDLTEQEKYERNKVELTRLFGKTKEAIESGNLELAKMYQQKYDRLVEEQSNFEMKNIQKLGLTKKQVYEEYEKLLKKSFDFKMSILSQEERREQQINMSKLDAARQQLEATKAQIEAEKQLVKVLGNLLAKAKGAKFEMDFTAVNNSLKNIDSQIKALEDKKREIQFKANLDAQDAKRREDELRSNFKKPLVTKQKIDTSDARRDIKELYGQAEKTPVVSHVDVDTKPAENKLTKFIDEADHNSEVSISVDIDDSDFKSFIDSLSKGISTPVDFVVGNVDGVMSVHDFLTKPITSTLTIMPEMTAVSDAIWAIRQPTQSTHTIIPNATTVLSIINKIKKPTFSYHTIYVRKVYLNSSGGMIGDYPKFADGGWLPRSGKLPGFGGGDRIKALLEAGEYIHNKFAVQKYGVGFMEAINSMAIPKSVVDAIMTGFIGLSTQTFRKKDIARFATGGSVSGVGSTSGVAVSPSAPLNPVNIIIGGEKFGMFADRAVAESLAKYMKKYGGR